MPKKQKTTLVLVCIGTLSSGFKTYGPFEVSEIGENPGAVKEKIILQRGHFEKDAAPFFVLPIVSVPEAVEEGELYVLGGSLQKGFSAVGPFKSAYTARKYSLNPGRDPLITVSGKR